MFLNIGLPVSYSGDWQVFFGLFESFIPGDSRAFLRLQADLLRLELTHWSSEARGRIFYVDPVTTCVRLFAIAESSSWPVRP